MNELREIKCRTCKENLDIRKAKDGVIECPYCASVYTLPKEGSTTEVLHFLNMGEHDLDICNWEGAIAAFKKAAEKDETEPEAYWGLALSDYKVQCIKDYVNNRMQPVCHEISERKFSDSRDYKKALKYATKAQSEEYAKKAAEIDYIKEEFYKLKQSELDFDSFICVKVTDENGEQTEDCKDAEYIYNLLKDKGYSPFFSEISIRNRTGTDYEAMILYALYSSETMLVVCRDEKYLQTPWVKNEYTRFLRLVNDEEKENDSITLIYYERPVEKLPGKRGKLQGIDLSRSGAEEQITDFVEKHTPRARKRREEAQRRKEEEALRKAEEAEAQARRIKELQEQVDALRESNANAAFSMNEILEKMEASRLEKERERAEEEARLKAEEDARKKSEEEARAKAEQGGIINKAEEKIKKLLFKAAKKVFGDKTEDSSHKKEEESETQTKTPDKENEQPEKKRGLFDELYSDDNSDKGVSPENDLLKAEKMYNQGLEFFNKKKYSEAVKWYTMSAERGYALAQNNLGLCYKNGIGVNQNYAEAVKWYERAARQGYSVAQYNLGYCYYNGQGVMQDYAEAVKWYTRSAEQGNAIAQYNLGNFYKSGIRQDYTEAAKWYERAARQGESKAQRNLGNFYYKGRGVRQDYAEAVKWYTRSAEQGDATAQYNLGLCYENGKGVKQNYREAIKWYTRAAKQEDSDAQARLKILKNRYGIQA